MQITFWKCEFKYMHDVKKDVEEFKYIFGRENSFPWETYVTVHEQIGHNAQKRKNSLRN